MVARLVCYFFSSWWNMSEISAIQSFLGRASDLLYPKMINWIPGLVNIQKAIENGPVEIVDLPIKHGDFP